MDKITLYMRESYNELVHNVTWPSYSTLQTNTILVLVGSAIFALLIFGMDVVWQFIIDNVYGITTG
ncbi:preprotein translocase subunit SecE [Neolewinella antarctica]|uniref:Protein translocase subunit SecE n=1 Tax=Neolewinella antarctica TaxID=442734 RepID=A0ABX0X869_9BACT|nr:preprotein translocase subunit SecE [Neolewinella antarctica]NJC25441.1 preprotein translocase subunit SecE [Neolewinella antarctica]